MTRGVVLGSHRRASGRARVAVFGLLLAYVILAVMYNAASPIFEAPDEIWHYMYVRHLAEGKGLPIDAGRDRGLLSQQEAAQPPLYYVVAAVLSFWAPRGDLAAIAEKNVAGSQGDAGSDRNKNLFLHGRGEQFPWTGEIFTVHVVRLTSTLWGLLTVLVTFGIGRAIFLSVWEAIAGAAVVAFNPEFLFMSAAVNNDVAVAAMSAVLLWLAIKVTHGLFGRWSGLCLGAAAGAVILAKPIAAALVLLVFLSLALRARQAGLGLARFALQVALASLACLTVCGGWFIHNLVTYGSLVPLQTFVGRSRLFDTIPSPGEFVADFASLRLSFWAVFGWFSILAPDRFYQYVDVLVLLAGAGFLVALVRRGGVRDRAASVDGGGLILVVAQVLLVVVGISAYRLVVLAFQGRLLLGAMSGVGVLLALGWGSLAGRRHGPAVAAALSLSLGVAAALMPIRVIRPSYAAPPTITAAAANPQVRAHARFGDDIRLLGVDADPPLGSRIATGSDVKVRLYFQPVNIPARNNVLFLKLVDVLGQPIVDINTHPAHGALPTASWRPPEVVVDDYQFKIPSGAAGPSLYRLFVGFFPLQTMENLDVWSGDGKRVGTSYEIGRYVVPGVVDPNLATAGNRFQENGRDVIAIVDSQVTDRVARPGATLEGRIVFGSIGILPRDYTVFVHLDDSHGELVGQHDCLPAGGAFPTTSWAPGDRVEHPWKITTLPTLAAGDYVLNAGFYDIVTGQRLTTASGNSVILGTIHLE